MLKTFGQFVTGIMPSFERRRVEEDLRILRQDLSDHTLPPYQAAAEAYANKQFQSRDNDEFDRTFGRRIQLNNVSRGNYVQVTSAALTQSNELMGLIETRIDEYFGRDIAASGLTYTRINVLRLIDLTNFVVRYARKLLLWTHYNEAVAAGSRQDNPFVKAEIDWIYANRDGFFKALSILTQKPEKVMAALKTIPDMIVVPEEVDVAAQTVGGRTLDPLQLNFVPVWLNPIYHAGLKIAEYQAMRYKAGAEERRALDYQLLALENARSGTPDPKLEQQIEYTQNRRKKLNAKLAKYEKED